MTVSGSEKPSETKETVIDGIIRAGAEAGLGWEDIHAELIEAGFTVTAERVREVVLKRTRASQRGSPGGPNAAG